MKKIFVVLRIIIEVVFGALLLFASLKSLLGFRSIGNNGAQHIGAALVQLPLIALAVFLLIDGVRMTRRFVQYRKR
jgi:hypothetical protein